MLTAAYLLLCFLAGVLLRELLRPSVRELLSRAWFAFVCWPSTLRPLIHYALCAALFVVGLVLLYLGTSPPHGWEQTAGAAAESEQDRERRRILREELEELDRKARQEKDREELAEEEQKSKKPEKGPKKAPVKKGGK